MIKRSSWRQLFVQGVITTTCAEYFGRETEWRCGDANWFIQKDFRGILNIGGMDPELIMPFDGFQMQLEHPKDLQRFLRVDLVAMNVAIHAAAVGFQWRVVLAPCIEG